MRRKLPESGFQAVLPMVCVSYGAGLLVAGTRAWPVGLCCLAFGTVCAGIGIYADYSDAKRKARGR